MNIQNVAHEVRGRVLAGLAIVAWFGIPVAVANEMCAHHDYVAGWLVGACLWLVIGGLLIGRGPYPRTLDDED